MIRVMVQDRCQCDPKKCTAKKMVKFGLAENIGVASIPAGAVVLSPFAAQALSPADAKLARRSGLVVMDMTWTNIEEFPKIRKANERALPYLLASNPVNWGRPMELNSAEAIFAALIFLGEREQADRFVERFNWAPEFLKLNGNLLDEYSKAKDSTDVVRIQNEYVESIKKD
jgi:pre-rRNA-processing protein TSR3